MAITIASEKEITVSGMVIVSPGSRIFPKESSSKLITRSFIDTSLSPREPCLAS